MQFESAYPLVPLGQLVEFVNGDRSSNYPGPKDYEVGGVPFISATDVGDGRVFLDTVKRISRGAFERLRSGQVRRGDILLCIRGSLGKLGVVRDFEEGAIASSLVILRSKNPAVLGYLRYVLSGTAGLALLGSLDNGSVQGNISVASLKQMEVPLPPRYTIEAIGSLMGLLNDRIDLLRQTNTTLESIAQALFKSWFIDFDPVRAKQAGREPEGMDAATAALFPAEFEESTLGLIPKGWRMGTVRDVCLIFDSRRIPLSGKDRAARKGPYPYYGAAALMDYVDDFLFDGVYVLLGEDGSVTNADGTPVTQYVWGKFWVNNHAHVLQGANGVCTEHLMLGLRGIDFTPYVTGAVQAKLNQANLFRVPFLIPSAEVSAGFESEVAALYEKLRSNVEQVQTLAEMRDALLPRLISGKLRLPEAQEQLEESFA